MSPFVRWILAITIALVLILLIVGIFFFSLLALAFGSDSCSQISNGASTFLLIATPVVMALAVIVAAILFGLDMRWQLWLGSLAIGGGLGICGYVAWFVLIMQLCK